MFRSVGMLKRARHLLAQLIAILGLVALLFGAAWSTAVTVGECTWCPDQAEGRWTVLTTLAEEAPRDSEEKKDFEERLGEAKLFAPLRPAWSQHSASPSSTWLVFQSEGLSPGRAPVATVFRPPC